MEKSKKLVVFKTSLVLALFLFCMIFACFNGTSAHAETYGDSYVMADDTVARGIACNMHLAIGGENSVVSAMVKNTFTLGFSTIFVALELYYSEHKPTDYLNMTLIQYVSTPDLNMGQSLRVDCPTGGKKRYWCAVARYKRDDHPWQQMVTDIFWANPDATLA